MPLLRLLHALPERPTHTHGAARAGLLGAHELRPWALGRLQGMAKSHEDCEACGVCVERCPCRLTIPEPVRRGAVEMPKAARG